MEPQQYQELLGLIQRLLIEQTNTKEKLTHELSDSKHDLQMAQREIEHLRGQLEDKVALVAAKDETIRLLRGMYDRPN